MTPYPHTRGKLTKWHHPKFQHNVSTFKDLYGSIFIKNKKKYPHYIFKDFENFEMWGWRDTRWISDIHVFPVWKFYFISRTCDPEKLTVTWKFDKEVALIAFFLFSDMCESFNPKHGGFTKIVINSQNVTAALLVNRDERFKLFENALNELNNEIIFDCSSCFNYDEKILKSSPLTVDDDCFFYNESFAAYYHSLAETYFWTDSKSDGLAEYISYRYIHVGERLYSGVDEQILKMAVIFLRKKYEYSIAILEKFVLRKDFGLFDGIDFLIESNEQFLSLAEHRDPLLLPYYFRIHRMRQNWFALVKEHTQNHL